MTNEYDELLIEGLSKLKKLEFSHIPEADKIDYTFSEEYVKSKEKLLNKLGTSYWKYVNTIAKKAAVIIIALIISFSSLMTVDAFREKVLDFVYKIYDTFTQIESKDSDVSSEISTYYSTRNIPSAFIPKPFSFNQYISIQYWTNKTDQDIVLTQNLSNELYKFNTESSELTEIVINSTPCLVCKNTPLYYCYWEFDGYRFELIYPIDLGEEFMSEVVGNLVEIDPAELEN